MFAIPRIEEIIMTAWLPLIGPRIGLPASRRRKDRNPCRGAPPLPGRGDAAMKSLRKEGRTAVAVL